MSATDFRVHFKDIANSVAALGERVLVERHGHPMVALVSQKDLDLLRLHKTTPRGEPAAPDRSSPALEDVEPPENEDPWTLEIPVLEYWFRVTLGMTDDAVVRWHERARTALWLRTGKDPGRLMPTRVTDSS